MFAASDHYGLKPDINITIAKGIASGLPIGRRRSRARIDGLEAGSPHASTFGGNRRSATLGVEDD